MSDEWVEVRNCTYLHEAEFFRSLLEGAGIQAEIPNEYMLGMNPAGSNFLGGGRVLVRPQDADRARELLDSGGDVPPEAPDEGEKKDVR
jgi:hypothetical protein